ncbi:hypothetical protein Tco_1231103 [Tanacetum coccineum]
MALGYQNPFYLKQAQQSLYNGKVLLEKHDPPAVYDSEETLQLAQESHLKMKQLNKEIKKENYAKINHLSGVFVSQTAKSREDVYFSNTSKMVNVSISISIPNEEFSDDTSTSVARKFLNEVKTTIVTLQHVVKQKMTLDIHNWSSSAHQEIHKIVKDEILPIFNQVDARVQNFEIQFSKEATKFVRDFKSLAKEADLELKIERLLRAVVSQDIMSIVQNDSIVDTLNLQTELDPQLSDKVSEQKDTTKGTSVNTKFANQSTSGTKLYPVTSFPKSKIIPKVVETIDLLKPVTSNSVPTLTESKVMTNDKVITPGMFGINLFKTSKEDKFVPINQARASVRTNPITVSQPRVINKKDVNSDSNGLSSTGVDNTARRP